MESTLQGPCILCETECISIKKDLCVCEQCFQVQYAAEKATVRKLVFEPADHIIDNIFLGPEKSAINLQWLRDNSIDRIIIVAAFCDAHFKAEDGIEYLHIDVDDSPLESLRPHFDSTKEFITKKKETNVLVHCISGISRSGAVVIAYMMRTQGLTFQ